MTTQQQLDFGDAARLVAHLVRCGFARAQAELAGLVLAEGERREVDLGAAEGVREFWCLRISSRSAAAKLRVSHRAVQDAAARLVTTGWFRAVQEAIGRPPLYVLDAVAARSIAPVGDRLDELLAAPAAEWRGVEHGGKLPASGGERWKPAPVVSENIKLKSVVSVVSQRKGAEQRDNRDNGNDGNNGHSPAVSTRQPGQPGLAARMRRAWDVAAGITGDDLRRLVAAASADNREALGHLAELYEQARRLGWIDGPPADVEQFADGPWFRFLVCAHHAASRAQRSPIGALRSRIRRGLDVARTRQASDDFAGRMLALAVRDPALAERLMSEEDR